MIVAEILALVTALTVIVTTTQIYLGPHLTFRRYRGLILWCGLCWLFFAYYHLELGEMMLGLHPKDAVAHAYIGRLLALAMSRGQWDLVWEHFAFGNAGFQVGLGFVFWILDSDKVPTLINLMMAYWGSMALLHLMASNFPNKKVGPFLPLLAGMSPSLVIWSPSVLKEATMWWSINMAFCGMFQDRSRRQWLHVFRIGLAFALGTVLRVHAMILWAGAIMVSGMISRGKKIYAVVAIISIPIMMNILEKRVDIDMTAESAEQYMDDRYQKFQSRTHVGSLIRHGPGGPIPVVSGVINTFFRPFFWSVRKATQAAASLEIWTITGLLLRQWAMLGSRRRRQLLKHPVVQCALVLCFAYSAINTYATNEGTLVRQRLQMMPGVMALLGFAWLTRARPLVSRSNDGQRRPGAGFWRPASQRRSLSGPPGPGPVGGPTAPATAGFAAADPTRRPRTSTDRHPAQPLEET